MSLYSERLRFGHKTDLNDLTQKCQIFKEIFFDRHYVSKHSVWGLCSEQDILDPLPQRGNYFGRQCSLQNKYDYQYFQCESIRKISWRKAVPGYFPFDVKDGRNVSAFGFTVVNWTVVHWKRLQHRKDRTNAIALRTSIQSAFRSTSWYPSTSARAIRLFSSVCLAYNNTCFIAHATATDDFVRVGDELHNNNIKPDCPRSSAFQDKEPTFHFQQFSSEENLIK